MDTNSTYETEQLAELTARLLADDLRTIGAVTCAPRLNGYALFEDGVMFGLVENDGTVFLRTNTISAERFHELESTKHGELPYWTVPRVALHNIVLLRELAYEAADTAHIAASFGINDEETVVATSSLSIAAAISRTLLAA